MDPEPSELEQSVDGGERSALLSTLSDWIWRSWYAKLWWALILIYWIGAGVALKVEPLALFYDSALAGFINVFMFPPTVLIVLGAAYLRDRMAPIDWSNLEPIDWNNPPFGRHHEIGMPPPEINPLDPRSGVVWIGNPANPMNGNNNI